MQWVFDQAAIDWNELSELYRIAPLAEKKPDDLKRAFANSMYKCFVYDDGVLVGAGRALADGVDCSYLCDVAVHPRMQGKGLGGEIIDKLVGLSSGHGKIILYANPGTEGFYRKRGFLHMKTAMAIFRDKARAVSRGLVQEG